MKLDVPLVFQKEGSPDCGPACVAMMLQYYDIDATIDSLKEEIEMYDNKWKGSFMPQLALPFLKRGFSVEIVLMDPRFFRFGQEYNQEKIKDQLMKEYKKEEEKELAKLMREFMKRGGVFKVEIPAKKHIEESLAKGNLLCALLTTRILTAETPGFNQHFVVIKGLEDDQVIVNDPIQAQDYHGGEQKHNVDQFLYGIHACAAVGLDTGCFMIVKKK